MRLPLVAQNQYSGVQHVSRVAGAREWISQVVLVHTMALCWSRNSRITRIQGGYSASMHAAFARRRSKP